MARVLRVAPSDITGQPWQWVGRPSPAAQAALLAVEDALDAFELGADPGVEVREWPVIASDLGRLADLIQQADYTGQSDHISRLLGELHALYVRTPQLRQKVLLSLIRCYSSAVWVTKRLGGRGLALVAAIRAQQCAEAVESPAWRGYATWLRGDATGALSRPQQYTRATEMAEELRPFLNDSDVLQAYGMLHLSAALAKAVQRDRDTSNTHLDEATAVARRMDGEVGTFGNMWFSEPNVGIWRVTIGRELGDGAKIAEQASKVQISAIPSVSRQAEFHAEVGCALLTERATSEQGLTRILQAEDMAPQRIQADVFAREAVAKVLRDAPSGAGGLDLRGLAWRMGLSTDSAHTKE